MNSRLLSVRRLPALLIILLLLTSTAFAGHDSDRRNRRNRDRAQTSSCDVDYNRRGKHRRGNRDWWQRSIGRWVNAHIETTPYYAPSQRWIPGHYEWRYESVCVRPGRYEKRWVPPLTETRYQSCGTPYTVVIREGYYDKVWVPARYEQRKVRVWVPGTWSNCS